MLEKTQIWREHESAACLIHLWMSLDNSIMCQAAKGSNCPLFENSIRCPLTQFWRTPTGVFADDDRPLADDVEKQLNVVFAIMKAAHCCFGCRAPTGEFADAHCWWQMPTGWWRCPLATSLMLTRLSVWQPLVNFIDICPPLSAERRDNLLQNIFELPPFRCRRVSLLYSLIQLHESTIIYSLLAALCVIVVGCRTETIFWL